MLEISKQEQPSGYCWRGKDSVLFTIENPQKSKRVESCIIVLGRFYYFAQLCRCTKAFSVEWFYGLCSIHCKAGRKTGFELFFVNVNSPPLSVWIVSGEYLKNTIALLTKSSVEWLLFSRYA